MNIDEEMFDTMTDGADVALYESVTYKMMQGYWSKTDKQSNASKHDKEHLPI